MEKSLHSLLEAVDAIEIHGSAEIPVAGLTYDSRHVARGWLFFALTGIHSDGHDFIGKAISAGAAAIVHEKPLDTYLPGIAYVRVADSRLAMSPIAAAFHDFPSGSLGVIGITGTEGKSTTVSLVYQLLNMAGLPTGYFSTVMADCGSGERPNPEHQTTPEATSVQERLAAMRDSGLEYAVVESSSHGLSERTGRLADVDFDIGIVTNVTREHLEFHGTWERYRHDKANLFRRLDMNGHAKKIGGDPRIIPSCGIVNADDPSASYFAGSTARPVLSFSIHGADATMRAVGIVSGEDGASFTIEGPKDLPAHVRRLSGAAVPPGADSADRLDARIRIPGEFNIGNALPALMTASILSGRPWQDLAAFLPALKPVRGRMMRVEAGQPFEVLIDYAHTPSSFQTLLPPLRKRVGGRIICVFGSGGERDTEKRPEQGRIASAYCDTVILADEDPRGEEPLALLEEIAAGCEGLARDESLFLIPDRPAAIRKAFSLAGEGDIVLLLGKGHENSIIYKSHAMPYDEETEALKALREMGFVRAGEQD